MRQSAGKRLQGARLLGNRSFQVAVLLVPLGVSVQADGDEQTPMREQLAAGEELFLREWQLGDWRSASGDGLGPMYNAASCVKCHCLGGTGGAGPNEANVDLLTVHPLRKASANRKALTERLAGFHPALTAGRSLLATTVLHRFSSGPQYATWRKRFLTIDDREQPPTTGAVSMAASANKARQHKPPIALKRLDGVAFYHSQRNTPALFGAGLIDILPDSVFEDLQQQQAAAGEVSGRVPRTGRGDVGRFGWRGQTPTLDAFVEGACAVELGLESPRNSQPIDPLAAPDQDRPVRRTLGPGLDINEEQCKALSRFVAHLPAPRRLMPTAPEEAQTAALGEEHFERIGCAACHVRQIGSVAGIYSDLLLHDMGEGLEDPVPANAERPSSSAANYYGGTDSLFAGATTEQRREWRTPPLWGVHHSAPYLHDGRARTLSEAIAWHDGEANNSVQQFRRLSKVEQQAMMFFLSCLAAPAPDSLRVPTALDAAGS